MKTLQALLEGGNVFKNSQGQSLTQRINQSDVPATVAWLEQLTGLDFTTDIDPDTKKPRRWLGSTGKAPTSGDLDLAVDLNDVSKDQLAAILSQWAIGHKLKPEEYVKKAGEVHFRTPITGRPDLGYVQTDFMFFPNLDWGTFFYSGGEDSAYKGANRNILMSSIAKQLGLKVGANGMFSRTTNQLVDGGLDPDHVAQVLLGRGRTRKDLKNVESIFAALARDKDREAKVRDFRDYLTKEGLPQPDAVQENTELYQPVTDAHFLARLRDRIVNQGMQVIIEADVQGGRAKGIEHLEDYVFRNGSAGIKKALDIVDHVKMDTRSTTTVKWDGSPALIFGRDANGTFVLTDVSGFTAKGYNGLFTSPRQVIQHLAARDADAAAKGKKADRVQELAPVYEQLWPMLDAAVPKNYHGYFQGDLLYMDTPALVAGNYVFQPNEIEYKIPAASDVGQRIGNSNVGIAMHTKYPEPGAPKQPIGNFKFQPVRGLLLLEPVYAKENVSPDSATIKDLKAIYRNEGSAIDQLFNPAELRAQQITDLPKLCIDYINSRVGTNFDNLLVQFGPWLQTKVNPRKYNNIVEYLQSPRSNLEGMAAAFTAWELLHAVKMELLGQLDLQHPGQEGWVMATPAGIAKAVNRLAGGFTAANRQKNNSVD